MLPILDAETANIHLEGLDKLGELANSSSAFMGELIGLVSVILIFGMPIVIVLAVLSHRSRRQRQINEMVMKLAEKGQPVPPELFTDPLPRPKSDLRRGIKLIAVGIGIMGFFFFDQDRDGIGIGFIPVAIGVGYLLAAYFDKDKAGT